MEISGSGCVGNSEMYLAPHDVSNNSIPLQRLVSHSNPLRRSRDKFNSGPTHFASLGVISPGFTTSCPLSSKVTSTVTGGSCFFLCGLPLNCRKIFIFFLRFLLKTGFHSTISFFGLASSRDLACCVLLKVYQFVSLR